jgi:hypothetical protein
MNSIEIMINNIEIYSVLWSSDDGCKLYCRVFENNECHWAMFGFGNIGPIQVVINKCLFDHQPHACKRVRKHWKKFKKNQSKIKKNNEVLA